jgi:hypothetical protein
MRIHRPYRLVYPSIIRSVHARPLYRFLDIFCPFMASSETVPLEMWEHIFKATDPDTRRSLALVSGKSQALATPLIYRSVTLDAIRTLLERPDFSHYVKSAKLVRAHIDPAHVTDFIASSEWRRVLEVSEHSTFHLDLMGNSFAAKAALLMRLCPTIDKVNLSCDYSSIKDFFAYVFPNPVPYSRVHWGRLQFVANFVFTPIGHNPVGIDVLLIIMRSLPSIHTVKVDSLYCDDNSLASMQIPSPASSSVQHLTLTSSTLSSQALGCILSIPANLKSFSYSYTPVLHELDLGALGDTLVHSPAYKTLGTLKVNISGSVGSDYHGKLTVLKRLAILKYLSVPLSFLPDEARESEAKGLSALVKAGILPPSIIGGGLRALCLKEVAGEAGKDDARDDFGDVIMDDDKEI